MHTSNDIGSNMDFMQKSGVKIPNAVIVNGVTGKKEQDDQVIDFLKSTALLKDPFMLMMIRPHFTKT